MSDHGHECGTGRRAAMTNPIPLTWAQQSWVLGPPLMSEDDAWRHDLTTSLLLPTTVAAEMVHAVVRRLVRRYPPLRSRFVRASNGTLAQLVVPMTDEPTIDDIAGMAVVPADHRKTVVDQVARHISGWAGLTATPNLVVLLGQQTGGSRSVGFAAAHAFVDVAGLAAAVTAFQDELRSPAADDEQDAIARITRFEASAEAARISARCIDRLAATARAAADAGVLESVVERDKADINACVHQSGPLFRALASWQSRLNRAATALSLGLIGYCGLRGRPGAWVVSPSANRLSKEEQQIVGLLMRSSWLLLEPRPDELFADLVQRAAGRLVLCMRNCRFDPAAALAEIARLDLICPTSTSISLTSRTTRGHSANRREPGTSRRKPCG